MPIVGLVLRTISATRNIDIEGGVKVSNNTNIREVKESDMGLIGKKGLVVSFDFKTVYESEKMKKSFAELNISGDVLIIEDKYKDVLDGWKKNKKLPDKMNIAIVNTVLRRCLTEGLVLSEKLNLPPPMVLPFASDKPPEDSRYIG